MKSAFECFQLAARCEQQAALAADDGKKKTYLSMAENWGTLAKLAQRLDRGETIGLPEGASCPPG
jgi:hypothetical protein